MIDGSKVRVAREKAGLTQAQVAEKLGCGPKAISDRERRSGGYLGSAMALCEAIGCALGDVLTDEAAEQLRKAGVL